MISNLREPVQPILKVVATPFMWISPNFITWLGVLPATLFVWAMYENAYFLALLTFVLTPVDMLDGYVARTKGIESEYGAFLDSTVDRIVDLMYTAGFAVAGLVSWPYVYVLGSVGLLISYIRSRAELADKTNEKHAVGIMQRPERIFLFGLATFGQLIFPDFDIEVFGYECGIVHIILTTILVFSIITIYQRLVYAYEKLD